MDIWVVGVERHGTRDVRAYRTKEKAELGAVELMRAMMLRLGFKGGPEHIAFERMVGQGLFDEIVKFFGDHVDADFWMGQTRLE